MHWLGQMLVLNRIRSVLVLFLLIFLVSCTKRDIGKTSGPKNEGVPVVAGMALQKTVSLQIESVGNVQAYQTVMIKSQVPGELVAVHFKEGEEVKKGELLFTIDSAPFEAELQRSQANLARDRAFIRQAEANVVRQQAQAQNAQMQVQRYRDLFNQGYVSGEQYDLIQTNAKAANAAVEGEKAALQTAWQAVKGDEAAIRNARIQLEYCFIRSPIEGRTGSLLVHAGNVIKANDVPLVTINKIVPTYVLFSIPEPRFEEVKKEMDWRKLPVEAFPNEGERSPVQGEVIFIDNSIDTTTGTFRMKGVFANQDKRLWPGRFLKVRLTLRAEKNAVLVPSQAVQTGQNGSYVFVIKPDMTVESRPVNIAHTVNGQTVIKTGLHPGEKVVTDGQLRLVPGAKVQIMEENVSSSP